jgi:two-component system, cell cycle sensor histidine kinase and response regulator CckA
MNAATRFPQLELSGKDQSASFQALLEHSPLAAARFDQKGIIVDMNPAFMRAFDATVSSPSPLRLSDLIDPRHRERSESLLQDLLTAKRDAIEIETRGTVEGQVAKWTAWRQTGSPGQPDYALLIANPATQPLAPPEESAQVPRWEAIGRLTGGVVHDFNNLLTGIMLYCDLLLATLDSLDRRRKYAEEIHSATVQAATLIQRLLVFARPPQPNSTRLLSLNQIAQSMHNLLTRLIGESISLDLRLDAELGPVKIDQAQAQQILLNLVLNARDALPRGGCITVETSNCRFQAVAGSLPQSSVPPFPCVLLIVGDNGHGMSAETRSRLVEPFFTTKNAGQGTGLGLTTVRSIVAANRGLIHFESEPGHGTRVMILLPRSSHSSAEPETELADLSDPDPGFASPATFHETKKESLL